MSHPAPESALLPHRSDDGTIGPCQSVDDAHTLGFLTGDGMSRLRALVTMLLALSVVIGASAAGAAEVDAAWCVRIVGGTWNPPGNDNTRPPSTPSP